MGTVRLSIVVPVYNDPTGVRRTLSSLVEQTFPADRYEILVVDNDSTDQTPSVVGSFCRDHPDLVTRLEETEIQSSYAARNLGIDHASGEYIAFVDADTHVDPDYAASVVRRMDRDELSYMGCNVEVYVPEETTMARYSQRSDFQVRHYLETAHFVPTCCLVTDAEVFETVGRFDSRVVSGGDTVFGQRVREAGFSQAFAPDITVHHPARATFREYLSRNLRLGRGTAQLRTLHPQRTWHLPAIWKKFAPPRPANFYETFGDEYRTHREALAWYFYEHLGSLAHVLGYLSERLGEPGRDGDSPKVSPK